jgi:hypothetical protein
MSLFLRALIKETADLTANGDARLSISMRAILAGTPKPKPPPPQTAYEYFVTEMFRAFSELSQAYENLMRMSDVARLKFRRPTPVTRLQFLTFVVEASVNEFYIFTERVDKFLTTIQKKYRTDRNFASLISFVRLAPGAIRTTLKPMLQIRGAHVHDSRLSSDDDIIQRAGTLELLVVDGGMKQLNPIYRRAMADADRHARKTIRTLSRHARVVANFTFKNLSSQLIDRSGRLRYPCNIKKPNGHPTPPSTSSP